MGWSRTGTLFLALVILAVFPRVSTAQDDGARTRLLPLRVTSNQLAVADQKDLTAAVLETLGKYPGFEVLPVPAGDTMDLMVNAGCIDFDGECLSMIGADAGADVVLFTDVSLRDGLHVVQLRLVDVKTREIRAPEGSTRDATRVGEFVQTAIERVFGPIPVAEPALVRVDISTTPAGGETYVDGDFIGVAPVTVRLAPGTYAVRVARVGYREEQQSLVVDPSRPNQVSIPMVAITIPDVPVTPPPEPREREIAKTPFYQTWWFWTVVGVVVVGAGTTAALLTTGGGSDTGGAGVTMDPAYAPKDVTLYPR